MKILCVSDYVDPLVYNQNVKSTFSDIDLVLCAGDLPMDYIDFIVTVLNKPTYFIFGNHNLKEFKFYMRGAEHSVQALAKSMQCEEKGHGAIYAGFKTLVLKNHRFIDSETNKETPLLLAGVSGSPRYNQGLCQFTDKEMKFELLRLVPHLIMNKIKYGRYLDIFLTHASPRHIHDHEDACHIGFECFNWFLKKFKPKLMIHGHIHLYDMREERIGKYYDTLVVNAYAHQVINFPEDLTLENTKGVQ